MIERLQMTYFRKERLSPVRFADFVKHLQDELHPDIRAGRARDQKGSTIESVTEVAF
jgi:hypothetical protein